MNDRARAFYIEKKIGLLLALIILAVACFTANAYADTGIVNTGVANVRSGPGTSYEITGTIYADTEVSILETSGSWYKIKFGNIIGWMSNTVLDTRELEYVVVTGEKVNLRSGPGTSYGIAGQVLKGDKLELLNAEGDWFKIKTGNGAICYITASLAQKAGASAQKEPVITKTTPAADTAKYIQAISGTVNVRSGPGISYAATAEIDAGQTYAVTDEEGDWLKIDLADGTSGYVAGWLVKAASGISKSPSVTTPTYTAPSATADTNTLLVYLNGQKLEFDVEPIIENDRTLVPLRGIFEAVGANVQWDETTRTVKAGKAGTEVVLTIGSLQPTVNGQVWPLDVPAKIVKDRTLAPLRFVGEAFGGQVEWDAASRTIKISIKSDDVKVTAIEVSSGTVNLRSGPAITYENLDTVGSGEKLAVLAERDGWYQVSRSGITGWVAGWVVDLIWEENEPAAETPVVETEPEPESEPEPVKPDKPGEDVVWLSSTTDEQGFHIIMESGSELDSKPVESSTSIRYTFKDKQIEGLYLLKKEFGTSYIRAEATDQEEDLLIEISIPSGAEYETELSDNGKKATVTIFNYITSVERKTFANTGERIIINTALPVDYTSRLDDEKIIVTLNNVLMGKAEEQYKFSSDLIKKVSFEPTEDEKSTLATIYTQNLGKHVFAESGEKQAFTVLMIEKSEIKEREKNLVVLDPGHGGNDTGARGTELDERDVNLDIALKTGAILTKNGIDVEYTRKTDATVGLEERALIANDLNAELFVSIHNNADTAKVGHGTETYFYAPLSTPELYMQRDERQLLAQKLQQQLISKLQRTDRGVKEKNLAVLRNTTMPSALVEVMFINCSDEQALLKQEKYRELAAEAIAQGILNYLDAK
ncbi:MAG TPA: N-acetylmuramoyl-L-alanine amidase [Syntrophomonadaceae bacterium]|nr:N-acetylmuramoyl-L-alanine amidase [Syntrophomonadaceae bacterium]HPR93313.1 N-acetylmuramoyl-L-alanine amidase [Syntrophomonadaceae bacterium]